jgi:hypothetical protein
MNIIHKTKEKTSKPPKADLNGNKNINGINMGA